MKSKKIILFNILFFIGLFGIASKGLATDYNLSNIVITSGEYKEYQIGFGSYERGSIQYNIMSNNTIIDVYFINNEGYLEFRLNNDTNDISLGNIMRELHGYGWISGVNFDSNPGYVLILNNLLNDVDVDINISSYPYIPEEPQPFISGYPLLLFGLISMITIALIFKKIKK